MKIKQRRQLKFDELIKYAWENNIEVKSFISNKYNKVHFGFNGSVEHIQIIDKNDLFTIEEEVEIDEETILSVVIVIWMKEANRFDVRNYKEVSIKGIISNGIYDVKAVYFHNEDGTIGPLIWKDGEMVE